MARIERTTALSRWAIAMLPATACLLLAAPAAGAKSEQAKFKVEVFAEQHTDWTVDHTSTDPCSQGTYRQHGSGGQSFSLTTSKPVKMTAVRNRFQGTATVAIFSGKPTDPRLGVPVNVAAIREGKIATDEIAPGDGEACGDGGGATPPPQPDCGSRSLDAEVRMQHHEPETYPSDPAPLSSVLTLSGPFGPDGSLPLHEQWQRCPGPANDTGGLIETPTGGLPAGKLFGKKKKFKVKATDSEQFSSPETQQTTRVSWTVEFTRRGK